MYVSPYMFRWLVYTWMFRAKMIRVTIDSIPLGKMTALSHIIFSDAFSWMESFVLKFEFY